MAATIFQTFAAKDKTSDVLKGIRRNLKKVGSQGEAAFARIQRTERKFVKGIKSSIGVLGQFGLALGVASSVMMFANSTAAAEQSMASLQAITGATSVEMAGYAKEVDKVSKQQRIFAADTAKAFELVGSAKPELLANAEALGQTTDAALTLAKAGKLEVTDAVNALTSSLNQFGAGADEATKFVDILATAQQKGSGTVNFLAQSIVKSGGVMKAFGNSFEDTVAILEGFAKAGVPASEAGTMLAGIMSKLSKSQKKEFNPQFTKATDIISNLAKEQLSYSELIKLTDTEGAKWLTQIINQNDIVQELTGNLNDVGNAQAQASIQTNTLQQKWKEINASFKNAITSTNTNAKSLVNLKNAMEFVIINMESIVSVGLKLIGFFVGLKALMIAVKVATVSYNIVLGISAALTGSLTKAIVVNSVALKAYKVMMVGAKIAMFGVKAATILWQVAAWNLNAALMANPIGVVIAAIVALVGITYLAIKNYEKWGAALTLILGPFGLIINLVMSFKKHWNEIKSAFTDGGFKSGIIAIGKAIFDAILTPIQQLLELLGKLPGMGFASTGAGKIQDLRTGLFDSNMPKPEVQTQQGASIISKNESIQRQQIGINFNNMPENTDIQTSGADLATIGMVSNTGDY